MENKHIPVLTSEVIANIKFADDANYLDVTLGSGGHSFAIVEQILQRKLKNNRLFAFDVDARAFDLFKRRLKKKGLSFSRGQSIKSESSIELECDALRIEEKIDFFFFNENFTKIKILQRQFSFNSVIADLGPSQNLINDKSLGLSFRREAYLDMRLEKTLGVTAADLLNILPKNKLRVMFEEYADIKRALRLAEIIVDYRQEKKFETTSQLNARVRQFISEARYKKYSHNKYSKSDYEGLLAKVYQALRIAVNLDYENLKEFLRISSQIIKTNGNLIVITFQSGEAKVVHRFMKSSGFKGFKLRVITPTREEIHSNFRSRSAKMYVIS